MKLIDIIRMSLGNLKRNKMRTVLTVSGVVVGIGAIVFLVSLGFGLQQLMVSKVANLDALTVITVRPGSKEETVLDDNFVKKVRDFKEVGSISPLISHPAQISDKIASSETVIYGVIPEFFSYEDIKVDQGSGLTSDDAKEAIVSAASLKSLNLTNPADVLGKELDFKIIQLDDSGNVKKGHEDDQLRLKIVGMTNEDKVKYAYAPLETLKKLNGVKYSSIKVKTKERQDVTKIRKAIESMGYPTSSVKDTVDQIDQAFMVIRSVLGGFGLIALLVAAIGIFNTMTISLLERTHEIGIMKAIGGRNKDVARIFAAEAAAIGLMGGLLGVFSGWLMGQGVNGLVNFIATSVGGEASDIFYTPLDFVGMVIVFSFAVSSIAGIWPARRASKLNPLEALRYE